MLSSKTVLQIFLSCRCLLVGKVKVKNFCFYQEDTISISKQLTSGYWRKEIKIFFFFTEKKKTYAKNKNQKTQFVKTYAKSQPLFLFF
jgi:hypothetical protein